MLLEKSEGITKSDIIAIILRVAALAAYHLLLMHLLLITPSFCPQSVPAIQSGSFFGFPPRLKI